MPIIKVVSENEDTSQNELKEAYTGNGKMINSSFLNGLNVSDAKNKIIEKIVLNKIGEKKTLFRLKTGVFQDNAIGDVLYQ